jgi:hypothetical protein
VAEKIGTEMENEENHYRIGSSKAEKRISPGRKQSEENHYRIGRSRQRREYHQAEERISPARAYPCPSP